MKSLHSILQKLREDAWYTQEELANMLGISRVTLANIESGKRDAHDMLSKYRDIFDMREEKIKKWDIMYPEMPVKPANKEKFKELLLYILYEVGMKPNIGKTVLYKLLYFCDFNFYELYGKSITGMQYIKLPKWPAPYKFDTIIEEMKTDNEILTVESEYKWYKQQKYFPNRHYQRIFSREEELIIKQVLETLSDANASDISEYSHKDAPWKETKDMEIIEYDLVKKREYPYSILQSEQIKQKNMQAFQSNDAFNFLLDEPDLYDDYVK